MPSKLVSALVGTIILEQVEAKYSEMGKWAKIGLITGAILGFGIAVYMRHSGFLMGKLAGLGIMFAGYFIGVGVDRRTS